VGPLWKTLVTGTDELARFFFFNRCLDTGHIAYCEAEAALAVLTIAAYSARRANHSSSRE
jgi:hypothetical protein